MENNKVHRMEEDLLEMSFEDVFMTWTGSVCRAFILQTIG